MTRQKWVKMNINVPEAQALEIDELIKRGRYGTVSDFVREAIRDKLDSQRLGVLEQLRRNSE